MLALRELHILNGRSNKSGTALVALVQAGRGNSFAVLPTSGHSMSKCEWQRACGRLSFMSNRRLATACYHQSSLAAGQCTIEQSQQPLLTAATKVAALHQNVRRLILLPSTDNISRHDAPNHPCHRHAGADEFCQPWCEPGSARTAVHYT